MTRAISKYFSIINAEKNSDGSFLIKKGTTYYSNPISIPAACNKSIFIGIEFVDAPVAVDFHIEYSYDGLIFTEPDNLSLSFNSNDNFVITSSSAAILNNYTPFIRLKFDTTTSDYNVKPMLCSIEIFAKHLVVSTPENGNGDFLLLESSYILLESGGKICLE